MLITYLLSVFVFLLTAVYFTEKWSSATTAMQRSLSFDNQWEQTVNDINRLVHVHVSEQGKVDRYEGS